MNTFTKDAQGWLDRRFGLNDKRPYRPHSTNTDFGQGRPGFLSNLGMTCKITMALSRMEFGSVLDVGASDGFNAAFIQRFFDTPVVASDLSVEALHRAHGFYGLSTVGLDSHQLPFQSNSFDVVICNETIEHVYDPVMLMLELFRVARRFVVISTLEYEYRPFWRAYQVRQLNPDYVHAHRTVFTKTDFDQLFPSCLLLPQLQDVSGVSPFDLSDRGVSLNDAKQMVMAMSDCSTFGYRKYGVLALLTKNGAHLGHPRARHEVITDALFEAIPVPADVSSEVDAELVKRLACPNCYLTPHELIWSDKQLKCTAHNHIYSVAVNTPLLYPQQSRDVADTPEDAFATLYPTVNREQAVSLAGELIHLRRTSGQSEEVILRYATSGLNLLYHPRAFIHHQFRKSRKYFSRHIPTFL